MAETLLNVNSDFLKLVTVPLNKRADEIDFAATDFATLRQALLDYIKAVYPLDYQNFAEADLGVMLAELFAYVGAVGSMKADMLANENFIKTAKNRNNVKKLLELIGVNMNGPISSMANGLITLNDALAGTSTELIIAAANRVYTVTSPEDSAPLNYTLYKTENGALVAPNTNSDLILDTSESDSSASGAWSNVVLVEGALVRETGTFSTTESRQRIVLTQSPVAEASVELFVDESPDTSGAWTRVNNIFAASGGTAKVFQVVYNDNLQATIVLGDNVLGKAPKPNSTYVVTYRVGGGSRGNVNAETINVIFTGSNDGADVQGTLENSTAAVGGMDAETVTHAKKYAPLTFRRQDRLVTLEDFTTFISSFVSQSGGSAKGTAATQKAYSSANIINVFILQRVNAFQLQQANTDFKLELLGAMNLKKMLTDEIVINDGLIRTMDLGIQIHIDRELKAKEEEIKAKVRNKILNFFSVDNLDFGQTLVISDLNREVFEVDEVRFSEVTNLPQNVVVDFNEIVQLNNLILQVNYV